MNGEIGRIRAVLAEWGYQLGRDDDKLLPRVACQVFLLNRSPHVEDLTAALFERIRREKLIPDLRLNTLHALHKAVAALGFCDPPPPGTGRRTAKAAGGPEIWGQWVERGHDTTKLTP
ncbi:site-specific integrase, partial [Streptomyces sp. NPDC059627]